MLVKTVKTYKDKYTGDIYRPDSTRKVEDARGRELIAKGVCVEAESTKTKKAEKVETPETDE